MKRKVMPSKYIAETYERLLAKYNKYYRDISKDPLIKNPLSSQKESWQFNNAKKDGHYYQSIPKISNQNHNFQGIILFNIKKIFFF